MLRVDLEYRLAVGHGLAGRFHDASHLRAHVVLTDDQAGRRIGETVVTRASLTRSPSTSRMRVDEILNLLLRRLARLALLFALLAEIKLAAGDVLELLAVKLLQVVHQPVVDAIGEQQHLDAALAEYLEVRAAPRRVEVLRHHVVDLLLAFLHALDVIASD
jgi:hypothetical protein